MLTKFRREHTDLASSAFDTVTNAVSSYVNSAVSAVSDLGSSIWDAAANFGSSIANSFSTASPTESSGPAIVKFTPLYPDLMPKVMGQNEVAQVVQTIQATVPVAQWSSAYTEYFGSGKALATPEAMASGYTAISQASSQEQQRQNLVYSIDPWSNPDRLQADIQNRMWMDAQFDEQCKVQNLVRLTGGLQMVGGALETIGGGLIAGASGLSEVGTAGLDSPLAIPVFAAGVGVGANGVDNAVTGFQTLWNGTPTTTQTEQAYMSLGGSPQGAAQFNASIGLFGALAAPNPGTFGGAAASDVAADDAFGIMMSRVDALDFGTASNRAVFYSGPGQERAAQRSQRTGGITIEMTPGGMALASDPLFQSLSPGQQYLVWQKASTSFAEGASGGVNAFIRGASSTGTFRTIEQPILNTNPNVYRFKFHY